VFARHGKGGDRILIKPRDSVQILFVSASTCCVSVNSMWDSVSGVVRQGSPGLRGRAKYECSYVFQHCSAHTKDA
jgi:hypothetical protein